MSSQLRDLSWSQVKIKAPISASPRCGREFRRTRQGAEHPWAEQEGECRQRPPARGFWGVACMSLIQADREFPIKASACTKLCLYIAIPGTCFILVLDLSNYPLVQKCRKWSTKRP